MEDKRKQLNLTVSEEEREDLEAIAKANRMSISALVRFLSAKVLDNPTQFGLLAPKADALAVYLN